MKAWGRREGTKVSARNTSYVYAPRELRELHARPRWELERELRRRHRADRIAWAVLGWCLGVVTLATAHLALLAVLP